MKDNTEFEIDCPACGKKMKKIYMPEQGINIDVCVNGCGGIFFDNRELEKFDENKEDISPLISVFENKKFKKVDETDFRICPLCGQKMVKNYASAKKEVQVDECYSCGGKFLDYGELEKIRAQYETEEERASDVIYELYSQVGIELEDFKRKCAKSKMNSSFLSKLIKIKY